MIRDILLVGAGSFVGGAARYLISLFMPSTDGFPWSTFIVNILGCLLIGILWGWMSRSVLSQSFYLFLSIGIGGGFTTFSTFSKESLALLQSGSYTTFAFYVSGSVVLGLLAVAAGFLITK